MSHTLRENENLSLSVKYILIPYFLAHSLNPFYRKNFAKICKSAGKQRSSSQCLTIPIMLQSIGEMSGDYVVMSMV